MALGTSDRIVSYYIDIKQAYTRSGDIYYRGLYIRGHDTQKPARRRTKQYRSF